MARQTFPRKKNVIGLGQDRYANSSSLFAKELPPTTNSPKLPLESYYDLFLNNAIKRNHRGAVLHPRQHQDQPTTKPRSAY